MWDTAGSERHKSLARGYYSHAQGAVICFDLTVRDSFINIKKWAKSMRENCESQVPAILFGCKSDLLKKKRAISYDEAQRVADENGMAYFETSAKLNSNVSEGF